MRRRDDQSEFEVTVKLPPGTSLQGSEEMLKKLEEDLRPLPGVQNVLTVIGADQRQQVDRGSILIGLKPIKEREQSQFELMEMARDRLKKYKELTIGVQEPAQIQGAGSTAELTGTGPVPSCG